MLSLNKELNRTITDIMVPEKLKINFNNNNESVLGKIYIKFSNLHASV